MTDQESEPGVEPFAFGKYEVLEEIGRGGMGVVYKARQTDLDRLVAIKMILPSQLSSEREIEMLYAEAQAAAKVSHPNVVGVFEVGAHNGQHFIAMEFVAGRSLAELLHEREIDMREAARLIADVARAVHFLHGRDLLHRDLKPANILVDETGRPRVTDFGLALATGDALADDAPTAGRIVGTPGYIAPELVRDGASVATPASDVYSLGAILYEAVTGGCPFGASSPVDALIQVIESEPAMPRSVTKLPVEFETIIMECLERDPERRYPTAEALATDLEQWLTGEPIAATPPAGFHRVRRWVRRHSALASRLIAFVLFLLVTLWNRFVLEVVDTRFLIEVSVCLAVWSVLSAWWERKQDRRSRRWIRFAWATTDATLLTILLLIADGVSSPLLLAYPLMIVTSGFWYNPVLVVYTAALALLSYVVLAIDTRLRRPEYDVAFDRHLIFVVVVILTCLVVAMQVRRTRAIGRFYARGA